MYCYIYKFGLCFLLIVIWNAFSPWQIARWSRYFLITKIVVPVIMVAVTSIWFGVGGIFGIIQLFRNLQKRTVIDDLDNGMVKDGVSLVDKSEFKILEKNESGDE